MRKYILEGGMVIGRWSLVERVAKLSTGARWLCECSCGTRKLVAERSLIEKCSMSCGCLRSEMASERTRSLMTKHGDGLTGKPSAEHRAWIAMRGRCKNINCAQYKDYGGRGIKVCERWDDYRNFLSDMGRRPSNRHSIDRIDVNGDYEPSNCRWATRKQQDRNKRTNRIIEFMGESRTLVEWCESLNKNYHCILGRLRSGWSVDLALSTPATQFRGTSTNKKKANPSGLAFHVDD